MLHDFNIFNGLLNCVGLTTIHLPLLSGMNVRRLLVLWYARTFVFGGMSFPLPALATYLRQGILLVVVEVHVVSRLGGK